MRAPLRRIATLVLALAGAASGAAENQDSYRYDPGFNGGLVLEDRFASVTAATTMQGQKVTQRGDGKIIVAGVVGSSFSSGGRDLGLVLYGADGAREAWSAPTATYAFFENRYVSYPNVSGTGGNVLAVKDLAVAGDYLYVLVDLAYGGGSTSDDVYIYVFNAFTGAFKYSFGAFITGLKETGAALASDCVLGQGSCSLVAVATYTTGGRQIITMKKFFYEFSSGFLTVDNAFGVSNNGAVDHPLPDSFCDAGASCSGYATGADTARPVDANPTIYVSGTAIASASESQAFVMAVNGADGSLATTWGGGVGIAPLSLAAVTNGAAVLVFSTAAITSDSVYLASNIPEPPCGGRTAVTKLIVKTGLPGQPTAPDFAWGSGGTRNVGGNNGFCIGITTTTNAMARNGNRLALAGSDRYLTYPDTLLAIVDFPSGALTGFSRGGLAAKKDASTDWGGYALFGVQAAPGDAFYAAGTINDAANGGATLFGAARLVPTPKPDALFSNSFE